MFRGLFSIIVVGCVLYYLYLTNPERGVVQDFVSEQIEYPRDTPQDAQEIDARQKIPAQKESDTVASLTNASLTKKESAPSTPSPSTPSVTTINNDTNSEKVFGSISATDKLFEEEPPKAEAPPAVTPAPSIAQAPKNQGELVLGNGEAKISNTGASNTDTTSPTITPATETPLSFKDALPSQLASNGAEVFFAFDSYELSDSGIEVLRKIADRTKDKSSLVLEIAGLTDGIGESAVNEAFVKARSQAVLSELQKLGFPRERLRIIRKITTPSSPDAPGQSAAAKRKVTVAITDSASAPTSGASDPKTQP